MSNDQSNPSASTPPTTPTQTGQVNGEIDQARDTGPNNTPRDQPNSIRIDDFIPDLSVEERQRWADTPLPTGGVVENGNAPQSDWDNQRSIYVNDLLPETQTGDILAMYAPFRQHPEDEARSAVPSEDTFHIDSETNHPNLQTDNSGRPGSSENAGVFGVTPFGNTAPATHRVMNGSAPIRDLRAGGNASMDNLPSVYIRNLQPNPIRRSHQAQRPVVPLSRMTHEQMQAFWQEFSDSEEDGEINDGAQDQHLVI